MNVLVIAPHPDDEVLGCGGTIAKHSACGDEVFVCIVTKGCAPLFSEEIVAEVRDECRRADRLLGVKSTLFLDFPAAMLENVPRYQLNDAMISLIKSIQPDIVYIPHRGDMQLDHKLIADALMVALRPKYEHRVSKIYAYETMSETGWDAPTVTNEFIANSYSDISPYLKQKLDAMSLFTTQLSVYPNARSIEALEALAKYRGSLMNMYAAEAFMLIRELR
jgi:LmbE family N-acetylglucosaminyl deacetylase